MVTTLEQLQTMCNIADAAGQEVMAVYAGVIASWTKDDQSPLTEADLRADAIIRHGLGTAFPGIFIHSEEAPAERQNAVDKFFLVDPLDGTKEFLNRNDEFTVNIALVHQGIPIAGVVLAPALGELYFAAIGLGAWKRVGGSTRPIAVSRYDPARPLRVIGSRSHGSTALEEWLSGLTQDHTFVAAGSSLKFCRIAEGQADVYPRFGPTSQWDTAAAQCVLEVAGGTVTDCGGRRLTYGLDHPILNPEFMAFANACEQTHWPYRP